MHMSWTEAVRVIVECLLDHRHVPAVRLRASPRLANRPDIVGRPPAARCPNRPANRTTEGLPGSDDFATSGSSETLGRTGARKIRGVQAPYSDRCQGSPTSFATGADCTNRPADRTARWGMLPQRLTTGFSDSRVESPNSGGPWGLGSPHSVELPVARILRG